MRYIRCAYCQERLYEDDSASLDKDYIGGHLYYMGVCAGCADVLRRDEGITLEEHNIEELISLYDVPYEEDEPDEIGDMWDAYHEARIEENW